IFSTIAIAVPPDPSVELELRKVRAHVDFFRSDLLFLEQHEVLEHEHVHVGGKEAAISIRRRANDRLAAHVEARVDEHRAAGLLVELLDELAVAAVARRIDRLDSRRIIHVRDCGNDRAGNLELLDALEARRLAVDAETLLLLNRRDEQHVRALVGGAHSEEFARTLGKHRRRERPERFAKLDLQVHRRLHFAAAGIAEDAAPAERTRTEFHAALEPSDDILCCEKPGDGIAELVLGLIFVSDRAFGLDESANLLAAVARAEKASELAVARS